MMTHSTPPYTIAFFTTGSDQEYSSLITDALTKVAKKQNLNIINILGGTLNPIFSFSEYKYHYQCNVAFDYAHCPEIDGIIIASGPVASLLNEDDFRNFYSKFLPTPMVSLGVDVKELPSVYANNAEIYTEIVSHIITVHHKKRIAFIAGPTSNADSYQRYLGYLKALFSNNLPYLPELVYVGDFTPPSGKKAIINLIDEKHLELDAIVCANDSMAQGAITELRARNFSIPEDILVTGCDNLASSAYCVPSLTTISQSMEKAIEESLHLLLDVIENKPVQNIIIPSSIHFRESCPALPVVPSTDALSANIVHKNKLTTLTNHILNLCLNHMTPQIADSFNTFLYTCIAVATQSISPENIPDDLSHTLVTLLRKQSLPLNIVLQLKDYLFQLQSELLDLASTLPAIHYIEHAMLGLQRHVISGILDCHDKESLLMHRNFSFLRKFLLTITHNISDRTKQLHSIIPSLMECGFHSFLIYLYPSGICHNLSDTWQVPDTLDLYMGYVDGKVIPLEALPLTVKSEDIATYGLNTRDKLYYSFMHPIFFSDEQLGMCVFELERVDYTLIESITVELACALKLSSTFNVQRQTESKLATLSQTDELTGLLNRRGFFNLAQNKFAFSLASHHSGVLFYADMDGLKTINDTYGHHEGDYAIRSMANILKETFSNTGILGRIGGDEFVILCTNQDISYITQVSSQINTFCKEHNCRSGKPYELSISIGGIFYESTNTEPLESLLSKADRLLYKEKHIKKQLRKEADSTLL